MKDFSYGAYDELAPQNINEPHFPLLILADKSGSMYGAAIQNLISCINRMGADICKDVKAARCVDVAVVAFNHEVELVQNWRPITELQPVSFYADGSTDLDAALRMGMKMVHERAHLYEDVGIPVKKPWIVLITDGKGNVTKVAEELKKRAQDGKLKLWVLAVKDYDKATIAELTEGKHVFELVDGTSFDFSEFFDFVTVSTKVLSTSAANQAISINHNIGREGSKCRVPDLDAWLND